MSRIERRWRLGVVAGLMALLTAAIVAGAGQSAPSAQGGTIVAGTTDTVTNIDPAGDVRLRVVHARPRTSTTTSTRPATA